MIVIRVLRLSDLPPSVPEQARRAIRLCWRLEGAARQSPPEWGRLAAVLVSFHQRPGEAELDLVTTELDASLNVPAAHTEDLLMGMVNRSQPRPRLPPGHVGTAVVTETIERHADAPEPAGSPEEMTASIEHLVATGRARQFRTFLAAMSSGWRFELRSFRGDLALHLSVCPPGEPWPDEERYPLMAPLRAMNTRLAES